MRVYVIRVMYSYKSPGVRVQRELVVAAVGTQFRKMFVLTHGFDSNFSLRFKNIADAYLHIVHL